MSVLGLYGRNAVIKAVVRGPERGENVRRADNASPKARAADTCAIVVT